jgi:hypothetical protein
MSRPAKPKRLSMALFLGGIDFEMLRGQKLALLELCRTSEGRKRREHLEGLLGLVDNIQDIAVDIYGYDPEKVFLKSNDEDQ